MKEKTTKLASTLFAFAATLTAAAALLLAPSLRAQTTNVSTSTTITVIDSGGNPTSDHIAAVAGTYEWTIEDGVTLTFKNDGQSNANGTIANFPGAGTFTFIVRPVGSGSTGNVVFDGGASFLTPSFSAAGLSGAAFYLNTTGQTINVTNGTFQNYWGTGNGGVIRLQGASGVGLAFNNVTFVNNGAVRAGSSALDGGVLWGSTTGASGVFRTVAFTSNTLSLTNAAGTALARGGVGFFNSGATLDMQNAVFTNNTIYVNASTTATARGGVIYQTGGAGLTVLRSGTFKGNAAIAISSGGGAASASGGAFYQDRGTIDFTDVLFDSNTAYTDGGAYVAGLDSTNAPVSGTLNNVTFTNNSAGRGGAFALVYNGSTSAASGIIFHNDSFTNNHAGNVGTVTDAPGLGGAMFLNKATTGLSIGVTITDVLFADNTAMGASGMGGAIYMDNPTPATINVAAADLAYTGNIAYGSGATADATKGGFAYLANTSTLNINVADGKTLTIGANTDTDADTIIGDATAAINLNTAPANTGAITLNGNSAANLAAVTIAAGSLKLANANAALGGPITIAANARAGGIGALGTLTQTVTLASNATLQVGLHDGASGILNIAGDLLLNAGSILDFNVYSDTDADLLNIAGALTQSGATASTLNFNSPTLFTTGSIALINIAGGLSTFDPELLALTYNNAATTDAYLTNDASNIYLVFGAPPAPDNNVLYWTGATGSSWTAGNWLAQGTGTTYVRGDIINIADDTTGAAAIETNTINIDTTGAATVAALYLSGTTSLTITGNALNVTSTLGTFTGSGAATGKLVLGAQAAVNGDSYTTTGNTYTGTLALANTYNTFSGGIDIHSGELVGNALTLAIGASSSIAIDTQGALTFSQTTTGTYASLITGRGRINKNGAATLTLAANNSTFTGTTNINAGTLAIAPSAALGGLININPDTTLAGSGAASSVNLLAGGTLALAGGVFTITDTLTLADGAILRYNIAAGGSLLANTLVRAAGDTATIDLSDSFNGAYKLLEITGPSGLLASATNNLILTLNGADLGNRISFAYTITGNSLYLDLASANFNLAWSGTNGSTWGNGYANFQSSDGIFMNGDAALFDDTVDALSGTRAVAVDSAGVQAVDMRVNTAGAYTFTGGGITTSATLTSDLAGAATGKLTIDGPGLVTFSNTGNHFEGGILVNAGTLALGANNALGAAAIAPALTLANTAVFTPAGYLQTLGEVNTAPATTIIVASTTISGTIAFAGGGVINGAITGTAGQIQVTGGNLVINSANTALAAATAIAAGGTATLTNLQALGTGAITIAADGALALANSGTGTLANVYSGAGRLMFTGSGTTTLASSRNNFTGSAYVASGASVLVTQVAALGNTPTSVEIDDGGKINYSTSTGVIANNISGSGTLQIQSASTSGTQTLSGAITVSNIVALTTGRILVATPNSFGTPDTNITLANVLVTLSQPNMTLGHLDLHGGARVELDPTISVGSTLNIASINATDPIGTTPTIRVNTDIGAGAASKIIVTGTIAGHLNLAATNTGDVPATMQVTIPLIEFPAGSDITFGGVGAFAIPGSLTAYSYIIDPVTGDLTATNTGQLSLTGASLIANASGAMPLTWFAELDTLGQRLRDLRMDARPEPGWDRWLRGYTQRLKVNDKDMLVPFREDQYGIEVGLDYGGARKDRNHRGYIGAFIGFGNSQRLVDYFAPGQNGRGNTTSFYAGVYATLVADNGWYLDMVGKYNFFKNSYSAIIDPGAPMRSNLAGAYNNHALGASLEFGKRIGKPTGFYITPSAQAALALISGAGYGTDEYTNLNVNMSSITTRQFRASITAGRAWASKDGRIFQAYLKAGAARQWTSGGVITVTKPSFDFKDSYTPSINGARVDAGAGFNWKISDDVQLYFDYDASWSRDYQKPYGLNAGCTIAW